MVGVAVVAGLATTKSTQPAEDSVSASPEPVRLDPAFRGPIRESGPVDQQRGLEVSRSAARDQPKVEGLGRLVRDRQDAISKLAMLSAKHVEEHEALAWVRPLSGYRITASFGQTSYLWTTVHTGIDLAAPTGTAVRAVGSGVVISASYDGSYGNKVVIRHEDGTETWYAHLDSIQAQIGQVLQAGTSIGTVGATGNVTGPHLHLEVRPGGGDPVNPSTAFTERGLPL